MTLSKSKANFCLDIINTPRNDYEVLDFVPYCDKFPKGDSFAILNKNKVLNILDLNCDGYHPWNGTDRITKKAVKAKNSSLPVFLLDNKFVLAYQDVESASNPLFLKLMTNRHCLSELFRREIFYIVDENKNLVSNVVYRYTAKDELTPPHTTKNRMLPSDAQKLKLASVHRSTNEAKKLLMNEGICVSTRKLVSLSRSVESHMKSNIGRKAPSDYHVFIDRYVARPFKDEVMDKPDIFVDENGKVGFRVAFGYKPAFEAFVSALPTIEDLEQHREEVSAIERLRGKEAQQRFNSFLGSVNASGAIPLIGSCISVDTTFSLSTSEYVTLAIGVSDAFMNKSSSKSSSILLAAMIHSTKNAEVHKKFSTYLNQMFLSCDKNRRKAVGTILVDGEEAFRYYNEGTYLSHALALRCDRHRLDNIKLICATNDEFLAVQKALFGEREKSPTGSVLKESVLQVLCRDNYTERLHRLLTSSFVSDPVKEWLMSNSNSLFEKNSLINKLRGGWPVQYLTTNIIEAKNGWIKSMITCKQPGEQVMNHLLHLHRIEINDRINAMTGGESSLKCHMFVSSSEWKNMKIIEKRNFLNLSGLGFKVVETSFDNFPSWVLDNISNVNTYVQALENLEFFETDGGNTFFLHCLPDGETTKVSTHGHDINCSSKHCNKSSAGSPICVHRMKVLQQMTQEKRELFLRKIEEDKRGITYMQLMRDQMKPSDGTKYAKRKGKTFSSNNDSRAIERLSSSFEGIVRFNGDISTL